MLIKEKIQIKWVKENFLIDNEGAQNPQSHLFQIIKSFWSIHPYIISYS